MPSMKGNPPELDEVEVEVLRLSAALGLREGLTDMWRILLWTGESVPYPIPTPSSN